MPQKAQSEPAAAQAAAATEQRVTQESAVEVDKLEEVTSIEASRDSPRLALGPASGDPAPPLPPPHLRQEIVLGKYDEGKQQFEARYTHSLADVKQAMMRTQVHSVYSPYWCKVQVLTQLLAARAPAVPSSQPRRPVYLLYWYKSTNTDAEGAEQHELQRYITTSLVPQCKDAKGIGASSENPLKQRKTKNKTKQKTKQKNSFCVWLCCRCVLCVCVCVCVCVVVKGGGRHRVREHRERDCDRNRS